MMLRSGIDWRCMLKLVLNGIDRPKWKWKGRSTRAPWKSMTGTNFKRRYVFFAALIKLRDDRHLPLELDSQPRHWLVWWVGFLVWFNGHVKKGFSEIVIGGDFHGWLIHLQDLLICWLYIAWIADDFVTLWSGVFSEMLFVCRWLYVTVRFCCAVRHIVRVKDHYNHNQVTLIK